MLEVLSETLSNNPADNGHTVILVTNEFIVGSEHFRTYLLIFPDRTSIDALVDSMKQAQELLGYKAN